LPSRFLEKQTEKKKGECEREKKKQTKKPEEEGIEGKEQLVREVWWRSGVDRSSYSCPVRLPFLLVLSPMAFLFFLVFLFSRDMRGKRVLA
jgi:hypothetical protein